MNQQLIEDISLQCQSVKLGTCNVDRGWVPNLKEPQRQSPPSSSYPSGSISQEYSYPMSTDHPEDTLQPLVLSIQLAHLGVAAPDLDNFVSDWQEEL